MQAIILVGGLGTRLRTVVKDCPKPMAQVVNKPFVEYLLEQLYRAGIRNIVFAVGYKGEIIENYFGTGEKWGVKIQYAYEKELLGTAGAIRNAQGFIKEEYVLVMNGDTYYEINYHELMGFSLKENLDMAIVLREVSDISRYGKVTLKNKKIIGFNEKEILNKPGLINGGIYLMKSLLINQIHEGKVSLENEMIPQWLSEGKYLGGIVNNQYFIDIGVPDDYYKFIHDIELKNDRYRKQMLEQIDLLVEQNVSAASSCLLEWKEQMRQYLREIYGVSSKQYEDFLNIKFEPERVSVNSEYRKEIVDFCRGKLRNIRAMIADGDKI